jgi:hypothetical protein
MPAGSAPSRREGSGGPGAVFQDGQGAQSYWGKSTFSTERGYHGRQKKSDDQDRRPTGCRECPLMARLL